MNFGNRYRKEGNEKEMTDLADDEKLLALDEFIEKPSSMDASTSSDNNGSSSGSSSDGAMMDDQSESSSALISALRETANLYCDSPFPTSFSNMLDDDFLAVPTGDHPPPVVVVTTLKTVAGAAKYEIPFIHRPPTRRVSKRKQPEVSQELPLQENEHINTVDDSPSSYEDTGFMVAEENQRKKNHPSNVGEPLNEFQFDDLSVEMEVEDDEDDEDSHSNFSGGDYVENLNLAPSDSTATTTTDNGNSYVYTGDSYYAEDDQPQNFMKTEVGILTESPVVSISDQKIAAPSLMTYPKVFAHQGLPPIVLPPRGDPSILNPTKSKPPHEVSGKAHHPISMPSGLPPHSSPSSSSSSSSSPVAHSISSASSTPVSSPSLPSMQPPSLVPSDEKLPPGWVKCISKREGRVYWFNSHTGQSSWILPR